MQHTSMTKGFSNIKNNKTEVMWLFHILQQSNFSMITQANLYFAQSSQISHT